ncbi:MAG: endo alpha-1,4 polygalactosaminidase [Clostridia bacterium]|nr:endo alpha-1,4 polygalactosaminidase [Clostridia bacterium]
MKKNIIFLSIIILLLSALADCSGGTPNQYESETGEFSYRDAMRSWVIKISEIAKSYDSSFLIIPQNCAPLFTSTGMIEGELCEEFISAIDGTGQEGIFCGNEKYNKPRDTKSREYISGLLNIAQAQGITVLSVNYCDIEGMAAEALEFDSKNGFLSYISPSYGLDELPEGQPINENSDNVDLLSLAKNWAIILNPEKYSTKEAYIHALCETNYDILVIDAYFDDNKMLNSTDVEKLKIKKNGTRRLVISYLSIGEAEDYRYYWLDEYYDNPPEWIVGENPEWQGNYPVEYWNDEWQSIIATGENSYLMKIINAGFDGVYLDIVDGYETFEDN